MSVNLHVHICPVCKRPVIVRDLFREELTHNVTGENYVAYMYTRRIRDRTSGEALVREYLYFHETCHKTLLNALQILSAQAGRTILCPPSIQIIDHSRELIVILSRDLNTIVNLIRQATMTVLHLITLTVPEEIQQREGGYKPLDELPPELRSVVENAARMMGYDPTRYRIRVSRDLVEKGRIDVHLLLVLQGGVIRLVIPLETLLEYLHAGEEHLLKATY